MFELSIEMIYEIAVVIIGLPIVVFFSYLMHKTPAFDGKESIYKLTLALILFWISTLSQLLTECWQAITVYCYKLPQLQVYFETGVLLLFVTGLWELWKQQLPEN